MPLNGVSSTPGLATLLKSFSSDPVDKSIEYYISLLKRRQIRGSKPCAIATAYLIRRVITTTKGNESEKLIKRVRSVGKRLVAAAPRELAIGNVVRRVLGLIRDEDEESRGDGLSPSASEAGSEPVTPRGELPAGMISLTSALSSTSIAPRRDDASSRPPLLSSHTGAPGTARPITSMFSISTHPTMRSGTSSPAIRSGTSTPGANITASSDLRAEVLEGITEIIDELEQSDEQIAGYANEHVSPTETVFTYSSSQTVLRFLLRAARQRKFTVIHAENHPNAHSKTHSMVTGNPALDHSDEDSDLPSENFGKTLTAAGITVLLIPDSAIFALMSRANKVILSAHAVLSNGSVILPSGSSTLVRAAKFHQVPVIVLAATYKLSPLYPHDPQSLIEYGDVGKIIPYQDKELRNGLAGVRNPIWDFIPPEDVDLYVTNVGSIATGYLYRIIRDQYRDEDAEL